MRVQQTMNKVTGRARLSLWLVLFLWASSIAAAGKLPFPPTWTSVIPIIFSGT